MSSAIICFELLDKFCEKFFWNPDLTVDFDYLNDIEMALLLINETKTKFDHFHKIKWTNIPCLRL